MKLLSFDIYHRLFMHIGKIKNYVEFSLVSAGCSSMETALVFLEILRNYIKELNEVHKCCKKIMFYSRFRRDQR